MKIIDLSKKNNQLETEFIKFIINLESEIKNLYFTKNIDNYQETLSSIQKIFQIEKEINIINSFDNSNFYQEYKLGSMIWFEDGKFIKYKYRRFRMDTSIKSDYEMMYFVLKQRLLELKKNQSKVDLFLIDGGLIQKNALIKAMNEVSYNIDFICMAKGVSRNAKNETFHTKNLESIKLIKNSAELLLLQKIRDETHNFAISGIRKIKLQEFKK